MIGDKLTARWTDGTVAQEVTVILNPLVAESVDECWALARKAMETKYGNRHVDSWTVHN